MAETIFPEGMNPPESNPNLSRFQEIQSKLIILAGEPEDPSKKDLITSLKSERARIVRDAKDAGIFDGIKQDISLIELHATDTEAAKDLIAAINTVDLENDASTLPNWNPDFGGMLEEYRNVAYMVVERADLKIEGATDSDHYKNLTREIGLRGWGTVPTVLAEGLAKRHLLAQQEAYIHAEAIARAQGIEPPLKTLESFRDGEEFLKPTQAIVPGSEPRFWIILDEDAKKEWYVRSSLMIAGYKKSMAGSTEDLYMDKMRELAVETNKTALKTIFKKPGVLAAVGVYTSVIGDKRYLDVAKREDIYDKDGNPIGPNLKKVFCDVLSDNDVRKSLSQDFGEGIFDGFIRVGDDNDEQFNGLNELENRLRQGCADSFYPHSGDWGTKIEEASFRQLKKSVRYWFATKGRDLLLKPEERENRDIFFGNQEGQFRNEKEKTEYKKALFVELYNRARDAEQIAWNFTYVTDTLETFDSREFRPAGTGRHAPSSFWALFQWVPMHPQERFEAKIKRSVAPELKIKGKKGESIQVLSDDLTSNVGTVKAASVFEMRDSKYMNGSDWVKIEYENGKEGWLPKESVNNMSELEAKEDWSSLGTWGVYNLTHGKLRDGDGKFHLPDQLKVLPDTMIRGPLFIQKYEGPGQESSSLFSIFNGIGKDTLGQTETSSNQEFFTRINWDGMSDSPFVPFIFDEMRWADVVTNVFKKGGERNSKVNGKDLSEAVYNLKLTRRQRDLLLMCYLGVNPRALGELKPSADIATYMGKRNGFLSLYPNYYLGV